MKYAILSIYLLIIFTAVGMGTFAQQTKAPLDGDVDEAPKAVSISSGKAVVPMALFAKKPVVEVMINGKGPFKLFLDTGAGGTVLDKSLADELKLATSGTIKIGDPADPQAIAADRHKIEKLEIGGASFTDLIAVSFDRSSLYREGAPRGVLGMPLFRGVLLTIDYPNSRVEISKGSLPAANGSNVINYSPSEGGTFEVALKVGDKNIPATLDTGSQSGLSFPPEYMEKLQLDGKPVEIGRGRTVAGEAIIYGAKLKDSLQLGGYTFNDLNATFFGRLAQANLGYGFLSQFAITIDQTARRMRFERASKPAEPQASAAPARQSGLDEYTGLYGERRLTVENNALYLQRLAGPLGEGPKIKLAEISKDAFGAAGTDQVRVKFVRNAGGEIIEIQVLTQAGEWETSKKGK